MIRDSPLHAPLFSSFPPIFNPSFPPHFHPSRTVILTKKWLARLVKLIGRQIIRDWWQDAGTFYGSIDDFALKVKVRVDRWLGIGVDMHLSNLLYPSFFPSPVVIRTPFDLFPSRRHSLFLFPAISGVVFWFWECFYGGFVDLGCNMDGVDW